MKKYLTLFLSVLLFACNQNAETSVTDQHNGHEHAETEAVESHTAGEGPLTLNNGAKWVSDESTDRNVAAMQQMAQQFKQTRDPQVTDFTNAGNQLGEGLQKMITECKMQGPDHDALHVWLEPLLSEVNQLKKVSDKNEGDSLFASIDNRLNVYQNYFAQP